MLSAPTPAALSFLTVAYAAAGAINGLSFIPQVVAAVRDRTAAASTSLGAWGLWTGCGLVGTAYAHLCTHDTLIRAGSDANTLGCALVFAVSTYRRVSGRRSEE